MKGMQMQDEQRQPGIARFAGAVGYGSAHLTAQGKAKALVKTALVDAAAGKLVAKARSHHG